MDTRNAKTSNIKLQTSDKLQASTPKTKSSYGIWSLEFEVFLNFEIWSLMFISNILLTSAATVLKHG
ncbi:MAG: hypothetical protein C5B50_23915 [Verrucomicrobia bacterium]|nr:MAG: hypothetical protein C5B50_23915 [Verrucomicrobiota bacterium]